MLLSEDHRAVQDAVRAYVQDHIAPQAAAWDKSHHFPKAELRGLAELGCYGVAVPTEWDGAGLDYLALAIILEEIAAGDGATSTVVSVNNCPVCSILMAWADDAQKAQWLKPLARGEMLANDRHLQIAAVFAPVRFRRGKTKVAGDIGAAFGLMQQFFPLLVGQSIALPVGARVFAAIIKKTVVVVLHLQRQDLRVDKLIQLPQIACQMFRDSKIHRVGLGLR